MPSVSIRRASDTREAIGAQHKDGTVYLYGGCMVSDLTKQVCLTKDGELLAGQYQYKRALFADKKDYTEIFPGDELVIKL